jgi:N-acetylmuramoyl-L-alanine amidase
MRPLNHVGDRSTKNKPVILVSAGHGDVLFGKYTTKGKQSPEWENGIKIYEGQSVKDLAYNLVQKLRQLDWPAMILNPEIHDVDLHIKSSRENTFYHIYNDNTYLIELHHNAQSAEGADYTDKDGIRGFKQGGASGTEIWTSPGETSADPWVDFIFEYIEVYPFLFGDFRYHKKTKNEKDKEAYFHMLTRTKSPAAIFEWLFMTTYTDCLKISSCDVRDQMVKILADAISYATNSVEDIKQEKLI